MRRALPFALSLLFAGCGTFATKPAVSPAAAKPPVAAQSSSRPSAASADAGEAPNNPPARLPASPPRTAPKSETGNPKSPSSPAALQPSRFVFIGRVLAVDGPAHTAIVELSPYAELPADPDGKTLFARDRELRPVARLQATSYLRGLILGVRTLEGEPAIGDEIVLPAPTPPPPAVTPAPPPDKPGARPSR
jgi:hypothetical protein